MLKTEKSSDINRNKLTKKAAVYAAVGFSAVAAAVNLGNMNNAPAVPKPGEAYKVYTVKPGETAWTISEKAYPDSDPRPVADMITKEDGNVLNPGDKIALPDSAQIGTEVPGTVSQISNG